MWTSQRVALFRSCQSLQPSSPYVTLNRGRHTLREAGGVNVPSSLAEEPADPAPQPPPLDSTDATPAASRGNQGAGQQLDSQEGWYWWERPAGPQTSPLRKMGSRPDVGEYLDSEAITRDPLRLRVGRAVAAASTEELPLPGEEALPLLSWGLGAAAASAAIASLTGKSPDALAMVSDAVLEGQWWRIWSSSLQPISWADAAASVAALCTAGMMAERRLGRLLHATCFVVGGALPAIYWYARSLLLIDGLEGSTYHAGAGAGLLASAAALLAYVAINWRVLPVKQRASSMAAAAALAAVLVPEWELLGPEFGAAAMLGVVAGLAASPRLQVQRELDISEGSMTISGNEDELLVVIDRVTAPRRWLACTLLLAAGWGAASLAGAAVFLEQMALLELLLDGLAEALTSGAALPELEDYQLLYDFMPDAFSTL